MSIKTSIQLVLIYIFCTSFLMSYDRTNIKKDTTVLVLDSVTIDGIVNTKSTDSVPLLVSVEGLVNTKANDPTPLSIKIENADEVSGKDKSIIKFQYILTLLIIVLMYLSYRNTKKSLEIQAQISKINVLPEIKKILIALDKVTHIRYFNNDEQIESNRTFSDELSSLIFYFNEKDEVYTIIRTLWDKIWEVTGKIGERESILKRNAVKEENDQYKTLSKEIAEMAKIIFNDIQKIKTEIIKRFQLNMG